MNKFESGEIVYYHNHYNGHNTVEFGVVDEHFSDGVRIDFLTLKENRIVNGIPIDDLEVPGKWQKLPKGWSWNTELIKVEHKHIDPVFRDIRKPEDIKKSYEEGLLVKSELKFNGYITSEVTKEGWRYKREYSNELTNITLRPDLVYRTYEEAQAKVDEYDAELKRVASLSDEEWSIEQIRKTLDRWGAIYGEPKDTVDRYMEYLIDLEDVETLEARIHMGRIQWKREHQKRWNNLVL